MSWPLVKLGDAPLKISDGNYSSKYPKASEFIDSGIPFLSGYNIVDGVIDEKGCKFISKKLHSELLKGHVRAGDVLITTRGNIGSTAVVPKRLDDANINAQLVLLRPNKTQIDSSYLKYIFSSPNVSRQISAGLTGSALKQLPIRSLKEIEIPIPSLEEQKRIAAILDKADAIRRKRQQAIQLADDFLRSVFLDMFGDYFTTEGYSSSNKKKIIDLVDYIDYRGKTPKKSESGVRLITAKNVKSGYISLDPEEFIPEENYIDWMTRGLPSEGDVLFTTEAPLGNAALLPKFEKVVVGQRLIALKAKGELTQEYLLYCLLNPFIQDEIYRRSSGSTVKGIRTKELYQIEIPIPQIDKQKTFGEIYHKHTTDKLKLFESAKKINLFFDSLSQKAFAGEL